MDQNAAVRASLPTERYSAHFFGAPKKGPLFACSKKWAACSGAKLAIFRPNGDDTPLLAAGRLRSNSFILHMVSSIGIRRYLMEKRLAHRPALPRGKPSPIRRWHAAQISLQCCVWHVACRQINIERLVRKRGSCICLPNCGCKCIRLPLGGMGKHGKCAQKRGQGKKRLK